MPAVTVTLPTLWIAVPAYIFILAVSFWLSNKVVEWMLRPVRNWLNRKMKEKYDERT